VLADAGRIRTSRACAQFSEEGARGVGGAKQSFRMSKALFAEIHPRLLQHQAVSVAKHQVEFSDKDR